MPCSPPLSIFDSDSIQRYHMSACVHYIGYREGGAQSYQPSVIEKKEELSLTSHHGGEQLAYYSPSWPTNRSRTRNIR